jgi:hypothetical protein
VLVVLVLADQGDSSLCFVWILLGHV